jgi:hypothetical protein
MSTKAIIIDFCNLHASKRPTNVATNASTTWIVSDNNAASDMSTRVINASTTPASTRRALLRLLLLLPLLRFSLPPLEVPSTSSQQRSKPSANEYGNVTNCSDARSGNANTDRFP